ncbi:hypothetical protein KY284_020070 [Solanum tuberosum]|nr:hypothetical protein KY284_020070 [Solanum tuberosum]
MFTREALFSLASAVGTHLQVDKATTSKSRPSAARVKVEVNLLSSLLDRVRMFFKDEKIGVVKEVLQKIIYDKLPSYYTTCKHQGHKEEECRLTMEIEGGQINETKINKERFEGDLRSILDEKKKVLSLQQTRKESRKVNAPGLLLLTATSGHKEDTEAMLLGMLTSKINDQLGAAATGSSTPAHIHVEAQNNADNNSRELIITSQVTTLQLSSRFGNDGELGSPNAVVGYMLRLNYLLSLEYFRLGKSIEQTRKLKECCHDDHTDQQALVTHEKESIVTEEIDGKEINPNTPVMFISNQEIATTDLNEAKEKQGETSATRWEDLAEVENHTPSPSRSKLSPQALEFVPTSKTHASMAVLDTSSNLSATKVNLDNRDILPDLGSDMSDRDDEDDMLDICFDKVAKDGIFHLDNKEVEAPNAKRRHMEDNIVGMVRSVRNLFQRTYRCNWQSKII